MASSAVLAAVGDLLAQYRLIATRRSSPSPRAASPVGYDLVRTLRFVALSVIFSPTVHFWYVFLERFFGKSPMWLKLALDQLAFTPPWFLAYFVVLSLLEGRPRAISERLWKDFWPCLVASWKLWPAVQLVTFQFIPVHLWTVFGNLVGLAWNVYFSGKIN